MEEELQGVRQVSMSYVCSRHILMNSITQRARRADLHNARDAKGNLLIFARRVNAKRREARRAQLGEDVLQLLRDRCEVLEQNGKRVVAGGASFLGASLI